LVKARQVGALAGYRRFDRDLAVAVVVDRSGGSIGESGEGRGRKAGVLRGLGADTLDVSVLPAERRRFLATMGRRLTPQALERRDPQRRYPILLTVLAQSATEVLDEVVALFDQAISAKFSAAEKRMQEQLAERGKSGEDRQALLDELLSIVTDPQIPDEEIGGVIRARHLEGQTE
jgi:hypothetical protein